MVVRAVSGVVTREMGRTVRRLPLAWGLPSPVEHRRSRRTIGFARIGLRCLNNQMAIRTFVASGLKCWLLGVAISASVCATESGLEAAPALQEMPHDRDYEIRVLYLEDPRLPTITAAQRGELYGKVEHLLLTWFDYRARLREVGQKDLAGYFAAHAGAFRDHPDILRMNLETNVAADSREVRKIIQSALAPLSPAEIQEQFGFKSRPAPEEAVTLAYNHFVKQLAEIRSIPLARGGTFADPAHPELNRYMHWCALTYEMTEADLVFTNSMIAGADAEMSLTIIARGGVTTGNTNANPHNPFGAAAMVGLFPFLSDAPFWMRERGPIPDAERLDVIATLTMHELGHMLLRRAHPSDHAANCVHRPPPRLRYYDWHLAIRKDGPCLLPHTKVSHY
jgi:hypothetical protein